MHHFTKLLSGGTAVALLGVGLSACNPTEAADPRLKPPLVRVATVEPAASSERAFTGVISARIQSNLGFRVGGKIIERLDLACRISDITAELFKHFARLDRVFDNPL